MRARRREINIFNMSLLDILCGALGAFCFMMLVALPYYKPPGSAPELKKAQEETARLMKDLDNMKDKMRDQKSVEEMEELLRRLEAQVKALQGQVNILVAEKEDLERQVKQLTAEKDVLGNLVRDLTATNEQLKTSNRQLTASNHQLTEENQKLMADNAQMSRALARRNPYLLVARSLDGFFSVRSLVTDQPVADSAKGSASAAFTSWVSGGSFPFSNETADALLSTRDMTVDFHPEVTPGAKGKVYLRRSGNMTTSTGTEVASVLISGPQQNTIRLPKVTLTGEHPWTLFGTIEIGKDGVPIFQEATATEREAEWAALSKATPKPTATVTRPSPPDTILSAGPFAVATERNIAEKYARFMHVQPLETGANDAEILRLADDVIKAAPPTDPRRQQAEATRDRILALQKRRQSAPSPTP